MGPSIASSSLIPSSITNFFMHSRAQLGSSHREATATYTMFVRKNLLNANCDKHLCVFPLVRRKLPHETPDVS